jgi:hypothetical protein
MIDIRIRSLQLKDHSQLDGVIDRIKTVLSVEDISMFQTFDLADEDPDNFIPLEEVTNGILMSWIKPLMEEDLPGIRKRVKQRNESKKKKAISTVDPDTGEISYSREDHIPEWKPGLVLEPGDPVVYSWETTESVDTGEVDENDDPIMEDQTTQHTEFYTTIQGHTTQEGWEPNVVAALFTSTFIFQGDRPTWKQPQGAHDAYPEGFEVEKDGTAYRSLVADNVWEPGTDATLWEEITEDSGEGSEGGSEDPPPEDGGDSQPEAWQPYDGTPDTMWNTGEEVAHNGSVWISDVDNNVWEPPEQWTEKTT